MVPVETESLKRRLSALGAVSLLGLLLLGSLILMGAAIQNSARFGTLFSVLIITNSIGLLAFIVLIGINIRRLRIQLRNREPGARLTLRMLLIFVALAVTPVLVLYGFSLDFLRRGVDSWFDVQIDQALNDSLELSRAALDLRTRELLRKTEKMAEELALGATPNTPLNLDALRSPGSVVVENDWGPDSNDIDTLRQRSGAEELILLSREGRLLASSSSATDIVPNLPSKSMLLHLRQGRSYIGLDPIRDSGLYVRVAVNVADTSLGAGRILQALYPIATRMGKLANSVEAAYVKYNELAYLRDKLKLSFAMTLTLVLLFSIVTAVWAAIYSARRLAAPIRDLAEGTAAVAAGNYETSLPVASNDEVGFLVSSFNQMTKRVAKARAEVETQHEYLNALLSQLSSGVIALDESSKLTTMNDSAKRILDLGGCSMLGGALDALSARHEHLTPFVNGILPYIQPPQERWQQQIVIFGSNGRRVLMCRGTALAIGHSEYAGQVIVFDDITAIVEGQRDAAWSEVARRLAHEIKNPLTPIQLSAERLRRKYLASMGASEGEALDRLTNTIIQQVDTMKTMVNTFAEYARPPKISTAQTDLNELIRGVVDLFRSANPEADFETRLDARLPTLTTDSSRMRQVFNNLVKNALEASPIDANAHIIVRTRKVSDTVADHAEIRIEDRGDGVPQDILENIFEPYVTNKSRGTGLGLAIVKKIIEEHGGTVSVENNDGPGATAIIRLPVEIKGKKARPTFARDAV